MKSVFLIVFFFFFFLPVPIGKRIVYSPFLGLSQILNIFINYIMWRILSIDCKKVPAFVPIHFEFTY